MFTGSDAKGRPTQLSRTVRGGRRDAQRLAAELKVGPGRASSAGRSVSDVLDAWVEQNLDTWAPSSARDQQSRVRAVKQDPIARLPLARLSVSDVERWHTRLRRAGKADAGIKNQHGVLRAALSQAQHRLGVGATVIVDEAGMLATPTLYQLVTLAHNQAWRLALVGDPRQLQGVGRGGLLAELSANGRVEHLEQLHRFTHRWEAEASLLMRAGDPRAFDAYEAHGRIIPGTLEQHLARIADTWMTNHHEGRAVAVVASTNDHVDTINHAVQHARLHAGQLGPEMAVPIAAGESAYVGDVVAHPTQRPPAGHLYRGHGP